MLKDMLSKFRGKAQFHAGVTKATNSYRDDFYGGFGSAHNNIPDHVPLYVLVKYANRDKPLALACRANTDLVCGAGYHLTGSNLDSKEGKDALEIIEAFCEHNHMDKLLQRACYDMWISGNTFMTWKQKDQHALRPIDQSNVVDIEVDSDGDPEYYHLYNRTQPNREYKSAMSGQVRKIPADQIIHWTFQKHESPFGTGLGQLNCRRGAGYTGADGQTYYRKSAVESREMEGDVCDQMLYGAQPRFAINLEGDEEVVNDTYRQMENMKPNQHIVSTAKIKVDTISNAPSNKFDSILKKSDDGAIIGTMSPYARIWSSSDSFSYASSKTAMASLFPLIDAMARELKHSVEALFRQVLERTMPNIDWKKNKVSIHFGSEKGIDLDRIAQAMEILESPIFDGMFNPESILEAMRNVGIPIDSAEVDKTQMQKHLHNKVFADDHKARDKRPDLERTRFVKHLNRKQAEARKWQVEGGQSSFKLGDGK